MRLLSALLALLAIASVSGCTAQTSQTSSSDGNVSLMNPAVSACIGLCQEATSFNQDLSAGPCLSQAGWSINDWACDVAHFPRQFVDDQPENQCHGSFHHFVEVDSSCRLIRIV